MKFLKFNIFYFLILFLICLNISQKAYSANNKYKINVFIDSLQRTVQGEQEIKLYNNSDQNLSKVYFLLGLNNNYDTKMIITEISDSENMILPSSYYKYDYLGKQIEDKTIYQVTLPKDLLIGESITLKVNFEISNLTKINDILFLDDNINEMHISSWYPRLLVFKDGIWEKRDFVSNDYDISVTVSNEETVVTSGIELLNENLRSTGQIKYNYKINNARGFSIITSKFISGEIDSTKHEITVKSFYKRNNPKWNKIIIESAKDVIEFYNEKFGFYPYKQLSIVPGNSFNRGGYVDNNIIILHDTFNSYKTPQETENKIKWYLAYYIAQQYFGYYIGESGKYPKWITSASSLYLAELFSKENNLNNELIPELLNKYISAAKADFKTLILQPVSELKNANFDWENIIEKGKSIQVFKMLENIIGRKTLSESLSGILSKYKYSIISLSEFQLETELKANKKLNWFFDQWVKEDKVLDYEVSSVKQTKTGNKYKVIITLKRIGSISMPVSFSIVLKNKSQVFQVWDGNKKESELTFEYSSPVARVIIDPAGILPDVNLKNNKLEAPPI